MDSLELIKTFREVAQQGNFSRAATRLNMSKGTVSKYIAELETRFGVRLLNRSTRSVSLTDAGALLLERSTPVLEMVELTQSELQERAKQPSGRVRISAPQGMGQGALPDLLGQFMSQYPEVDISLQLTSRSVDLAEEGIDIALRLGPIQDQNLIVRRLVPIKLVVCASPRYWRGYGIPQKPGDLTEHVALTHAYAGSSPTAQWRFEEEGRPVDVPIKSRLDSTENGPLVQLALQGFGAIYLPALVVQSHLDNGELQAVLQDYVRKDMWLYAAYLQRRHNSAAVRALLSFLEDRVVNPQAKRGPANAPR